MQDRVIKFLSEFSGVNESKITLETLVSDDLGIDGDDGAELLAEFSEKFTVDLSPIEDIYFGPEGFNPVPVKQLVQSAEVGKWVNI